MKKNLLSRLLLGCMMCFISAAAQAQAYASLTSSDDDNIITQGETITFTFSGTADPGYAVSQTFRITSTAAMIFYQHSAGSYTTDAALLPGEYVAMHSVLASPGNWDFVSDTKEITFTILPPPCSGTPTAGAITAPASICDGADANLLLTGQTSAQDITLQWQSSDDGSSNWTDIPGEATENYTATSMTASAYYRMAVTCTNSGITSYSAPAFVEVKPRNAAVVYLASDDGDNSVLAGDVINFVATDIVGVPQQRFEWYVDDVFQTDGTTFTYTPFMDGTVKVILSGDYCTTNDEATTYVDATDLEWGFSSSSSGNAVCAGEPVTLNLMNNVPDGYTVNYLLDVNGSYRDQTTNNFYTFYETESYYTDITIQITGNNGYLYTEKRGPNYQTVNPIINPSVSVDMSGSLCYGSAASFTAMGTDIGEAPVYTWYRNYVKVDGATDPTYTITDLSRYNYETIGVEVSNIMGSCVSSTIVSNNTFVIAVPLPDPNTTYTTTSGSTKLCEGDAVTFTSKSAHLPGASFTWYRDGVAIDGQYSSDYTTDQPGAITASVTTLEGCSRTATSARVINPRPIAVISENIADGSGTAVGGSFCSGSFITLYGSTDATGASYRWKLNGDNKGTAITQKASAAGDYTLTVTKNSCSATSFPYSVMERTTDVSVTADGATSFCTPGSVRLNAVENPEYTYQWYRSSTPIAGETNASYTSPVSGNYRVGVKNGACAEKKSAYTEVVATATPAASISRLTKQATFWTLRANPGTAGHTYQWYKDGVMLEGVTSRDYMATESGSYTMIATKGNCSATAAAYVIPANTFPVVPVRMVAVAEEAIINIFPNPSTGVFNIGSEEAVNVIVKDVQGRTVAEVKNASSIDLSNEASGIYFMNITDADGMLLQVERVVKQ